MNKELNTYDKWLAEGYNYFAETGPAKFSIKKLSEKTGLSRTSFHYYFSSKDDFFTALINKHLNYVREFNKALKNTPVNSQQLAARLNEFADGVNFQYRLFLLRYIEHYNNAYLESHEINFRYGLLDWLIFELGISLSPDQAKRVYFMFTDIFYTRVNNLARSGKDGQDLGTLFLHTLEDFKLLLGKAK